MAAPFDPTTKDKKEWDRLAASKWLPPIVQKEIKSQVPPNATSPKLEKVSRKIIQTFPHQEIKASHQTKKKLMSNVCTRFVRKLKMRALYLEELAIFLEAKEKQDAESMERKWTIAKQLCKSGRFLNYIHALEDRAKLLEDKKTSTPEQTKPLDVNNAPPQTEALDLKNTLSSQKASEHKSFYDLRDVIAISPFKPKEKSLKRVIVGTDEELTYDFSKPPNTSEDVNVEFGRAFRDIHQIGSVAKEKWSKALADKKAFGVRRSNDSVELSNSKHRTEVAKANLEATKQVRNVIDDPNQNPAVKNSIKFNSLRGEEHSKLITALESRKKDRFNRSKNLSTIQPVFKLIDSDMTKHTSRRQNSIWKDTIAHLWVEDPYNHYHKSKTGQKAIHKNAEVIKETPQISKVRFGEDRVAKLGWAKLKTVARFNGLSKLPSGPRTSIAVQPVSDIMRSEIMELMAK